MKINQFTGEEIKLRRNEEIDIRDTYVLPFEGKYYLYGTQGLEAFRGTPGGFLCYVGQDLERWEGPYTVFPNDGSVWADANFWAPEVYEIQGAFYMFASWTGERRGQRLCSLRADHPLGPFRPICDDLGPGNDPTLYMQNGRYYLIHNDGSSNMQAHLLSEDFSRLVGEPVQLFDRTDSDVTWAKGGPTEGAETYVTPTGKLLLLWSSFCEGHSEKFEQMGFHNMDYGTAIAYSEADGIFGKFKQENILLTPPNMGHVNLFESLSGDLMLATHWPDDNTNELGCSTPIFFKMAYDPHKDTICIAGE